MRGDPRLRVVVPAAGPDAPVSTSEPPALGSSPGRYLQDLRSRRAMSLEQLAMMTKIPRRQLALLEEDRFDEMPGLVFVKGFLRCYARALRVDEDTVINLFHDLERERSRNRRGGGATLTGSVARRRVSPPVRNQSWRGAASLVGSKLGLFDSEGRMQAARTLMLVIVVVLAALAIVVAFTMASSMAGGGAALPS